MAEVSNGELRAQIAALTQRLGRLEGIVETRASTLQREQTDLDRRFREINAEALMHRIDVANSRLEAFDASIKLAGWILGIAISALAVWLAYVHAVITP